MIFIIISALILVVALWIGWPWAAATIANRYLPKTWSGRDGAFTLANVSGSSRDTDQQPQVLLTVPVSCVRALAAEPGGVSIPPGVMRGGMSASGTWAWNELGPAPRAWQAQVVWSGSRARLDALLPIADLNRLIAYRLSLQPNLPLSRATLSQLRIRDDDATLSPSTTRRLAFDATGSVTWRYMGVESEVVIRRCTGWLHVRFETAPGGLHPVTQLEISALDTPLLSLPLVGQVTRLINPAIEEAVNRSLAQRLEGVVIPAWAPIDLQVDMNAR